MIERIVYSLWTSPMDEQTVGFNTEKAFIECFSLSLHFSKKWFKEVHLVTDLKGEQLMKKYGLTFDNINTDLETVMKDVYKGHWSLGKIYACKIQDKPFIHLDNDAILFKPLPESFLNSEIGFQNIETEEQEQWYKLLLTHAEENYKTKPVWFDGTDFKAYNCGIMAFNKFDIIYEWWDEALKYIDYLDNSGFNYDHHLSCLIYEQFAIYHLCKHRSYNVDLLSFYGRPEQRDLGFLPNDLAAKLGYTHLIATCKRNPKIELKIRERLKKEKIKIKWLK